MRVLWIADYFPRPHDPTTGVWGLETVRGLQRHGCDVVVFAPAPWIPWWAAWTPSLRGWAAIPQTDELDGLRIVAPRVFHYPHRVVARHLYRRWPSLDTEVVWRGCRPVLDRLVREVRFDAIHANDVFPAGYLAWRVAQEHGIPWVVHERSALRLLAALSGRARRALYARIVGEADAVITLNRRMAAQLTALTRRPVHVIPAGADPERIQAARALRPARYHKGIVLLCVGSFIPRKGHGVLVDAIARLRVRVPQLHAILVGDGPRRAAVERQIAAQGLAGRIELWGCRPHREVLAAMSWCDLFALPSWDEAFGTVYVEAMTSGRPIVACRGEGIADVVTDGREGLLVMPRDPEALADAVERLAQDATLRERMGDAARRLAETLLTYDGIARRLLELYAKLTGDGAPVRRPALKSAYQKDRWALWLKARGLRLKADSCLQPRAKRGFERCYKTGVS